MFAADRAFEDTTGYHGELRLWRAALAVLLSDAIGCDDGSIPRRERDLFTAEAREWIVTPSLVEVCDLADMDHRMVADAVMPRVQAAPPVIVEPRRKRGRPKKVQDA